MADIKLDEGRVIKHHQADGTVVCFVSQFDHNHAVDSERQGSVPGGRNDQIEGACSRESKGEDMTTKSNPYDQDTPEYQLYNYARSAEQSAIYHEEEAKKSSQLAIEAHIRSEKYRDALKKLTGCS